ncbi:MAG: bifunctional glutamate N-acetyltransferase/amino-acid acetyltransferase ArgJ [Myxococcales bacterium]|jgi:glutamate N-acetyltransferase/amino-acid N-acetyltransferase
MTYDIEWIPEGTVTTPAGFSAGGAFTGIKTYGPEPRLDVGILCSDRPAAAAGIYTRNRVVGAPLVVTRERVQAGPVRALVANSGNSNVATGEAGIEDARRMAAFAAEKLDAPPEQVVVASTGVIGRRLPIHRIAQGVREVELSEDGGVDFARAIMTTDTRPKTRALRVRWGQQVFTIGGCAKGSGMVHPDMATVFCFLTTDAPADPTWLQRTLTEVGDDSLNMLDVDMDTSTSDMMLLLANGTAGGEPITHFHKAAGALTAGLRAMSIELTRDLARDGEGARCLIEVHVKGAASVKDARAAARTVVASPLVKTMVTGRDANLGRVLMALGRSGAEIEVARTSVFIGEHCAFERGVASDVPYETLSSTMEGEEVHIHVDLGLGDGEATAYGCDLTEDYIRINADYTT